MAIVMVTSIAFVVTFQIPPAENDAPRAVLDQRVRDILAILNDTPVDDSVFGNNVLSVGLLECLQNNCTRLSGAIDELMPPGARYGVYLSTGEGLYPVYAPREPSGEAVTGRRLIEPSWSYQFMATAQDVHNPLEDPLVVYALPIHSANPIQQGGSALTILASGNRTADNAAYVFKGSATTRAVGPIDEPSPAGVSLFFHAGDGTALATRDVRATSIAAPGIASGTPVSFSVRVQESGGGNVPAGTLLTIALPHGWTGTATTNADWTVQETATNKNGSSSNSAIVAKLKSALSNGFVDLPFTATYQGDADDYYPFHAYLSAGGYASGALLVRGDAHTSRPAFEVPAMLTSVPRPLGSSSQTTWTLAAFSPDIAEITRIEIREEEDRAIFSDVVGLTGGGTWTAEPHRLIWTGTANLNHDSPLSLTFRVTSASLTGPTIDRAPFVPAVAFGNFTGALPLETAPGLHRGVFLPATSTYGGYDPTISAVRSNHTIDSASVYRTTALPGTVNYSVGLAAGLDDSVFGSAVTASRRTVAPGGSVALTVETQSLVYQTGVLGFDPTVTLNVYPPWAGNDRTPIHTETLYNGTLAKGADPFLSLIDTNGDTTPDTTTIGRLSTTIPIPTNWLYGAYVVEANVTWLETISAPPLTEQLIRSARVYDYFIVRPGGGELPSSPVYDVHLLTWFEDWG